MKLQLQEIINNNDLISKAWNGFWKNFDSYISEEKPPELKSRDSIIPYLSSYAYKYWPDDEDDDGGVEYIVIRIEFCDLNDKDIGYYDACFEMDGSWRDDFCIIY